VTTENEDRPDASAPQEETPAEAPKPRASRRRAAASAEGEKESAAEAKPRPRRRRATAESESTEAAAPATVDAAPKTTRRRTRATAPADAAPAEDKAATEDKAAATPRRRSRAAASTPTTKGEAKASPTRRRSRSAAADAKPDEADAKPTEAAPPARTRTRRSRAAAPETAEATATQNNGAQAKPGPQPLPRLQLRIRSEIAPVLIKEFSYSSSMQVPGLSKVVVNIGLGEALTNARAMEAATRDVTAITGQRPVTTRAKKSIAGFKIREGMPIGLSVTLRGRRMYEFVDRLISSALPRIRDFQGVPRESFDGRGNYSLGIREQVIFPEIDYNSIDRIRGLQVVICTTARTDREGLRLLEQMGMPFARTGEASRVA
jgi:large subunit ribosomal protein L5